MIFTHRNALKAHVYDADSGCDVEKVVSIDTETGIVETVAKGPIRVGSDGKVVTEKNKFRSIYPIFGGSPLAQLFLCYGKVNPLNERLGGV
ncbi:MAG: hypothetical protein WBK19_10540 [Azonexus sp.]